MGLFSNRENAAATAARTARIDTALARQRVEREAREVAQAEAARIAAAEAAERKRVAKLDAARKAVERDRARKVAAAKKVLREEARRQKDIQRAGGGR